MYEKLGAAAAYETTRRLLDRGCPPEQQRIIQEQLRLHNLGVRRGLEDLIPVKKHLDEAILRSEATAVSTVAIEFSGPTCLATTGTLTPDVDMNGRQLQVLHDVSTTMEWLSVALDVNAVGPAVVFSWLHNADKARRFVESILALSESRLAVLLPQLLFLYLGNTYFALDWWNGLSDDQRDHVRQLAENPNPYYEPHEFLESRLAPWSLVEVRCYNVDF